ncbi:hypothetical protein ACSBR1_015499 [Camellia fascicularis]
MLLLLLLPLLLLGALLLLLLGRSPASACPINLIPTVVSSTDVAFEVIESPIILMPSLKDRQLTSADTAMRSTKVAVTIVHSSILPVDAGGLIANFKFVLLGLFSAYEAMRRHERLIKAVGKLKLTKDQQVEKMNELKLRLVTSESKVVEMEQKLQTVDAALNSSAQEVAALKEEKQQLFAALDASKVAHDAVVKAAKEEGCNEATTNHEEQFIKLENHL